MREIKRIPIYDFCTAKTYEKSFPPLSIRRLVAVFNHYSSDVCSHYYLPAKMWSLEGGGQRTTTASLEAAAACCNVSILEIEVMVSSFLLSLWGTRFPKQKHNLSTLCALLRWYSPLLSSSKVAVELVIFVYCYTSFALSTVYSGFRVVVLNHQNIQHNNNQQLTINIPTNNHIKHHHPNHNKYTSR